VIYTGYFENGMKHGLGVLAILNQTDILKI